MTAARRLVFVVPAGIDDPARVSGGNVYDREVRDGLRRRGWDVRMAEVADAAQTGAALAESDGTALVDGLVAGSAPDALAGATGTVAILAHMPASASESAAWARADLVIATSDWTAAELARRGLVAAERLSVAVPGSRDSLDHIVHEDARELLCVGVVARHKGQDLLLEALNELRELEWTCTMAGSPETEPAYAAGVASTAAGFAGRVRLTGVLDDAGVDAAYARAGVLVAPSRDESFGMAIADARRSGLPVIATAVGGIPESVAGGGAMLVPGEDAAALAQALASWMSDPALRAQLRDEASAARATAPRWDDTIDRIDDVLGRA